MELAVPSALIALILSSSLVVLTLNFHVDLPPPLLNLTVVKPGLVLEKAEVRNEGIKIFLRNTAPEPLFIESFSLRVEAPISLNCDIEAPTFAVRALECTYDSSRDPAFKPRALQPGESTIVGILVKGSVELSEPSWSEEIFITLNLGNYTLRRRLTLSAKISGEALQASSRSVIAKISIEGNSTLRVTVRGKLAASPAAIESLSGASFSNFTGALRVENGALELVGVAVPPAQLRLNLSVSATSGAVSGYSAPLKLLLQRGELKLTTLTLEAVSVQVKPAFPLFPYAYEVTVPGVSKGYLLVAIGPHIYNITLQEGRGSLLLSEAFWPLLSTYRVEPLEVVYSEESEARAHPAVLLGEETSLLTGGITLVLIAAILMATGVYALRLRKLKEKCKPYIEVELE